MTQLDKIPLDDSSPEELSPQQFVERWKPLLESLDRMFADPTPEVIERDIPKT